MPASSNAALILRTVSTVTFPPFSNFVTVLALMLAWVASLTVDQPKAARAILTCSGVSRMSLDIVVYYTIFVVEFMAIVVDRLLNLRTIARPARQIQGRSGRWGA